MGLNVYINGIMNPARVNLRAAKAAARLARHYGATVAVFHVLRKIV